MMKKRLPALLLTSAVVFGSSGLAINTAEAADATIVNNVRLRSAPSTNSQVYYYLQKGSKVDILNTVNAYWYQVEDKKGKVGFVSSNAQYIRVNTASTNSGSNKSASNIEKVIATGMKYLGTPYEFGSNRNTTTTFDCSDFVKHIFKTALDVTLPSNSRTQGDYIKEKGNIKTSIKSLQRGDLVFFMEYRGSSPSSYPSDKSGERITHVGIYLGDGQILHTYSKESGGVRTDNMLNRQWEHRFLFGGSAL